MANAKSKQNSSAYTDEEILGMVDDEAARGFYRYWSQVMTSPDWDAIRSINQTPLAAE